MSENPVVLESSESREIVPGLPKHVAIIMDGNGRWAEQRGQRRLEGHKAGAKSVRTVVECCRRWGISYLTLFSFSTENWLRSAEEVSGLMSLFKSYLDGELSRLLENGIRLRAVGDLDRLPTAVRKSLDRNIKATESNSGLNLVLAMSYGGREEIVYAVRSIAERVKNGEIIPSQIDKELFAQHLWTSEIPDPDLLIRTSGEVRISNFLLWQLAYTEMVISEKLWPDFDEDCFKLCLAEFCKRERRYGLAGEQLRR